MATCIFTFVSSIRRPGRGRTANPEPTLPVGPHLFSPFVVLSVGCLGKVVASVIQGSGSGVRYTPNHPLSCGVLTVCRGSVQPHRYGGTWWISWDVVDVVDMVDVVDVVDVMGCGGRDGPWWT